MQILVADDHALYRQGVIQLIQELDTHIDVIEAADHVVAFKEIENNANLDLVLYDLNMPGKNGIDAVIAIADKYPSLPVIIISSSEDPDDLRRAIDAGAMGYIAKTEDSIVILNAIKLVLSGGVYVSPSVIKKKSASELASDNVINQLTPRQKEVLCCIVDGQSNKEIARSLQITDATIKVHLKTIFKILSVNNRTQAAMLAKNLGIQCD